MKRLRLFLRGIVGGLLWLGALFVGDTLDNYRLLGRSAKRIRTDGVTERLLDEAVVDFVVRMATAYGLLAVLAGVTVHFALRCWFPRDPERKWRWWAAGLVGGGLTTLLASLRQVSQFPGLHDWFPWPRWWCDHVDPWMLDVVGGALALAALAFAWRRWRAAEERGFGVRVGMLGGWLALVAVGLHNPAPAPLVANQGPNLVLIGIDALRPDHLAFDGYHRETAPNIDAFLRESVVFDAPYTPLARTYPAWIATLSGTLPITNGIRDNLPEPEALIPDVPLLPQVMSQAGWTTAFATDDSRFSYMVPETGFQHILQPEVSVGNFAVSVNEPRYRAFYGLLSNPVGFGLVPVAAYNQAFGKSYQSQLFADRAQDLLAQVSHADRFFYAIHSCVLHAPGDRSYPWYRMWGQVGYRGSNRFHYSRSGTEILVEDDQTGEDVNIVAEQDTRIYDSGIDMADRLVGQIVGELKRSGLWDNSVVVLFSDHVEETWAPNLPYDFNGPNHGFHAYGDAQFHVLLAVHFPDGSAAGRRVPETVRLVDLAPTLAEHFGVNWPGTFDGVSLLDLARGRTEAEPRPVYIETGLSEPTYWADGHRRYPFRKVSERYRVDEVTGRVHIRAEFRPQLIAAKDRVYQVGRYKLIWIPLERGEAKVQLFDWQADPLNRVDLALSHRKELAALGLGLAPYLQRDRVKIPALAEWQSIVNDQAEAVEP